MFLSIKSFCSLCILVCIVSACSFEVSRSLAPSEIVSEFFADSSSDWDCDEALPLGRRYETLNGYDLYYLGYFKPSGFDQMVDAFVLRSEKLVCDYAISNRLGPRDGDLELKSVYLQSAADLSNSTAYSEIINAEVEALLDECVIGGEALRRSACSEEAWRQADQAGVFFAMRDYGANNVVSGHFIWRGRIYRNGRLIND